MKTFLLSILSKIAISIGRITWITRAVISADDLEKIRVLLTKDYYIILTRRKNAVSTYLIGFAQLFLSGRFGYWSHSLMNLEDDVTTVLDFRLMEATTAGVHYSLFEDVFNVQSVALLKPKAMTIGKWTSVLDTAKSQVGKEYDTLFDIADSTKVSCIELVRVILMKEPDYQEDFKDFEAMIKKDKNLTPQMLYDCSDFEVVFEVKK